MSVSDVLSKVDKLIASAKRIELQSKGSATPAARRRLSDAQPLYALSGLSSETMQRIKELDSAAPHKKSSLLEKANEEENRPQAFLSVYDSNEEADSDEMIATLVQKLTALRAEIEAVVKNEGRRAFWNGFWLNTFFFVLGLAVSAVSLSSTQVFAFLGIASR